MATLSAFVLLAATCGSAIQKKHIVVFPSQQWLSERAAMLLYSGLPNWLKIISIYEYLIFCSRTDSCPS